MDWNAIGAIGEVVGATGVIATLIYLSVQIRQNTKAVRGAALDAITERKQFELKWSSEIAGAFRKSIETPETLTDEESWQLTEWMTAAFVARQNEYFQFKNGLIDAETWSASEKIIRMCLSSAWSKAWWQEFAPSAFSEPFIDLVDTIVAKDEIDYERLIHAVEDRARQDGA